MFMFSAMMANFLPLFLSNAAVTTASNFNNHDHVDISEHRRHLPTFIMSGQERKQRMCSKDTTPCPATDYVFIMDESGSIDQTEYNQMRAFVSAIVDRIPDNEDTRVGIIEFDRETGTVLELESNRTKVNAAVNGTMIIPGGYTATDEAVLEAIDMLSDTSRHRVMILLTDGQPYRPDCGFYSICHPNSCGSNRYVGDAIENFKTASDTSEGLVILVGIGGIVNERTSCLATSEDTIYEGDTFDDLPDIEQRLMNEDLSCLDNQPPQFECQDIEVAVEHAQNKFTIEPTDVVVGGSIVDPENGPLNATLNKNTFYPNIHGGATFNVTLSVHDGQNDCSCTVQVSVMVPPTEAPSNYPTTTVHPSDEPSATPSASAIPSIAPTTLPSSEPSNNPTRSSAPSVTPSSFPSFSPSATPTESQAPSSVPTSTPSSQPTANPTESLTPTVVPTSLPSANPSAFPTLSSAPSSVPTSLSSAQPSAYPTERVAPTSVPTALPSRNPSSFPTASTAPSFEPTSSPSAEPSANPTKSLAPTYIPTSSPRTNPSTFPTTSAAPSFVPTSSPSVQPSSRPSVSLAPTVVPTSLPSATPSGLPTVSAVPSITPTAVPSAAPSAAPTISTTPSEVPTSKPSTSPSAVPTVSNLAHIAQCKQDIVEIAAGEGCLGIIEPIEINQGSYDPDGDPILLSCDKEVLSIEYLNEPVIVTLTVSDGYLESTCTSKVVLTKKRPKAVCVDELRIPAVPGPNCESGTITASDIYKGASTNHIEMVLSDNGPFKGSHQSQTVELTVTENHCKLSDSCQTKVIVEDQGAVVEVDCDTPGELPICQKPIDVHPTAVSTTTGCPATVSSVALTKCQFCNGAGKVIDKTKGCGVDAHDGYNGNAQQSTYLTVKTPPGVGTFIFYEVEASADFSPESSKVVATCVICVERCGQGGNSKKPFFRGPFNCPDLDQNGLPPTWDDDSGLTCD